MSKRGFYTILLRLSNKLDFDRLTKWTRKVNLVLACLVVLVSGYIILLPLTPELLFRMAQHNTRLKEWYIKQGVEEDSNKNIIEIPSILVRAQVYEEGNTKDEPLGIWRRSQSSEPFKGGNTVIVGHRYLYTFGPQTFYHLDKIETGDNLSVFWEGERYDYSVYQIAEVQTSDIQIEDNTSDPILTLYTCTPLWTAEKRLVIRAKLVSQIKKA